MWAKHQAALLILCVFISQQNSTFILVKIMKSEMQLHLSTMFLRIVRDCCCYKKAGEKMWAKVVPDKLLHIQFPVRAHVQVAGLILGQSSYKKATNQCFSLSLSFSPLPLSPLSPLSLSKKQRQKCPWVRIKKETNI